MFDVIEYPKEYKQNSSPKQYTKCMFYKKPI